MVNRGRTSISSIIIIIVVIIILIRGQAEQVSLGASIGESYSMARTREATRKKTTREAGK